jgi:hypothetical protein
MLLMGALALWAQSGGTVLNVPAWLVGSITPGDVVAFNGSTGLMSDSGIYTSTGNEYFGSGKIIGWSSTTSANGSADTGLSRDSAGVIDVGNGTQGDVSGTVQAISFKGATSVYGYNAGISGYVNATSYLTGSNCAVNSASPAACGSAAAGAVVVPTTTTTYTVNTSAVTANSVIAIMPRTYSGNLPSSPTCVTPAVTSSWNVSAISAATSFTFTLPSTSGQTCWNYSIVN